MLYTCFYSLLETQWKWLTYWAPIVEYKVQLTPFAMNTIKKSKWLFRLRDWVLGFIINGLVFYNLILFIKWCKIPNKNLGKVLYCLQETRYFVWKTLMSSNYHEVWHFCWNFAHAFYLLVLPESVKNFSKFCLDLELFTKFF